ncbi:hypothetical protein [Sphingomonas sp.]|uniref:hypothetical protein n=1 Tax=Sphingomonas sp. TaxID=28214 RepID=UPI001D5E0F2F|nr:hypothetical protein [Sphingomonas sp.]MBX9795333.1 hypothetical protein [Sphingomonas sp.]
MATPRDEARAARLAQALRDNLKRRKARARALDGSAEAEPGADADETPAPPITP